MNLTEIEDILEEGLSWVQKLAPLASLGGPVAGAIGSAVAAIAALASNLVQEATNDASIIASGDVTKITAMQQQLQAANQSLAAQIAAS